ncbi:MAG: SCO1664 family protein [Anaerolineae bacterium]
MAASVPAAQPQPLDIEYGVELLSRGEMKEAHGLMPWSSNYTFLVTVHHEAIEALAIYKPCQGERPLWDFPDGTLALREVASFHVSHALGWDFIPPTVLREGFMGLGAVQLFIEADLEEHYFTLRDAYQETFQRVAIFDYIVNNADRKGGHCLKGKDGRIWTIDHGLTFHHEYKLRTVIWDYAGQPIPEGMLGDLIRFQQSLDQPSNPTLTQLAALLSEREVRKFRQRLDHIIAAGTFPLPGTGRNVPFPPI